jgi:maltose O-acetyltransferase
MFKRILRIFAWVLPSSTMRTILHRACGIKIGVEGFIGTNVVIDTQWCSEVEIADGVYIAPNVTIMAHASGSTYYHHNHHKVGHVKLCRGCWVGTGAIILPSVYVGRGAIVNAGSVVYKNVEPFTVVAGNPARAVGRVEQ